MIRKLSRIDNHSRLQKSKDISPFLFWKGEISVDEAYLNLTAASSIGNPAL